MKIELPVTYKKVKVTRVLDKKFFKICDIREKEIGRIRKKFQYVHFDGKQWKVLQFTANLSEIKYFKIE